MKRREGVPALIAGALIVLGVMAVFAIELANTEAKSRDDVKARVHERGVLAAALIDSLFQTTAQQVPTYQRLYGGAVVSSSTLSAHKQTNTYLAVLDSSGRVLASTPGFTPSVASKLPGSAALRLVFGGKPYGLGDVFPYGSTGVLDFATPFSTRYGERIYVSGFPPSVLGSFLGGELRKIPGVRGAQNYLIEGTDTVLGSTNPKIPIGHQFRSSGARAALTHASGTRLGQYYAVVPIANSTWRVVLAAPEGPLFASVTGLRKWIPWIIFIAFGLVALAALVLGRRVVGSAAAVHDANQRLAELNAALAGSNAKLERRAAELARSNAELEQFASIASHDLQEPLRKVRTYTEHVAVGDGDRLSEKGRLSLQRANAAAERMQQLIEDLLKFSRVSTHGRPFANVDLGSVTAEVLDDLEAQVHRSGAQITVGELPAINGDALQMRQLLQNLISNALKFRREGVTPEIRVDARPDGEFTELTVVDNGIGFEPQYSRRIFRVFERLHGRSQYPGTGIGLALCRKIAERHGGTISAEGVPGHGSTFTVRLPLNQREEVLAPHSHADHDAGEREREHVVV
jgi:signal transduction histidine kinase